MTVMLDESVRAIVDGKNFAVIATVGPDGSPQSSVVWVKREGDAVVFSCTTTRQKVRNLAADPRLSVTIFDLENPYSSVEIRGIAELIPDREKLLSRELSQKYLGTEPPQEQPDVLRIIVRVAPGRVIRFSA